MENFMSSIRRKILPNLIKKVPSQVIGLEVGGWVFGVGISIHPYTLLLKYGSLNFWDNIVLFYKC
jgi:hypothetical protein